MTPYDSVAKPELLERISELRVETNKLRHTMLGYPLNCSAQPMALLRELLHSNLNNLGDPFSEGNYQINTFAMEREIIHWFADLWHLPQEEVWGYVTCSGSEGNFRGIALGLERFPDGVVYCSDKAHYSVPKAARMMRAPLCTIGTDSWHRMDMDGLVRRLDCTCPAIVNLTVGTIMAGAVDDVQRMIHEVKTRVPCHIHIDAALSGLILPFVNNVLRFDFSVGADSITVSGHKFLGVPIPCAAFVTRGDSVRRPDLEYLGSRDGPLFGSRSGFAVLTFWYLLHRLGRERIKKQVQQCMEMVGFANRMLSGIGWHHQWCYPSTTILIDRPPECIVKKWQLAVEGDKAHIILMPHVSEAMITAFVTDLKGVQPCES